MKALPTFPIRLERAVGVIRLGQSRYEPRSVRTIEPAYLLVAHKSTRPVVTLRHPRSV